MPAYQAYSLTSTACLPMPACHASPPQVRINKLVCRMFDDLDAKLNAGGAYICTAKLNAGGARACTALPSCPALLFAPPCLLASPCRLALPCRLSASRLCAWSQLHDIAGSPPALLLLPRLPLQACLHCFCRRCSACALPLPVRASASTQLPLPTGALPLRLQARWPPPTGCASRKNAWTRWGPRCTRSWTTSTCPRSSTGKARVAAAGCTPSAAPCTPFFKRAAFDSAANSHVSFLMLMLAD